MPRSQIETSRWDVAEFLRTDRRIAAYLEAAFEDGDPQVIAAALANVARARGMAQLARDAGLTREGLYKALGPNGNPSFATVLKIARALGLQMSLAPAAQN